MIAKSVKSGSRDLELKLSIRLFFTFSGENSERSEGPDVPSRREEHSVREPEDGVTEHEGELGEESGT